MSNLATCLWIGEGGEAAAQFYLALFRAAGRPAELTEVLRHGPGGPAPEGSPLLLSFVLDGHAMQILAAPPAQAFSEAISLSVTCSDQADLDHFWNGLLADGGTPIQCGWLKDRYGLRWQVVPRLLIDWMLDQDPVRAGRVMAQMMSMVKLDIAPLRAAYEGRPSSPA